MRCEGLIMSLVVDKKKMWKQEIGMIQNSIIFCCFVPNWKCEHGRTKKKVKEIWKTERLKIISYVPNRKCEKDGMNKNHFFPLFGSAGSKTRAKEYIHNYQIIFFNIISKHHKTHS